MLDILMKKSSVKIQEDSLTACVFGLMRYLPIEMFWELLSQACYGNRLPAVTGEILEFEFWPNWSAEGIEERSTKIEPDAFISFELFDLIIEAKRWDSNQQDINQWKREVTAYYTEYGDLKKKLYFLALGGLHSIEDSKLETKDGMEAIVIKCHWMKLLGEVKKLIKTLSLNQRYSNQIKGQLDVLSDMEAVFAIHGYILGDWLEDAKFDKYSLTNGLDTLMKSSFLEIKKS